MATPPPHFRGWARRSPNLILEKYQADPNYISIKYHTTPIFLAVAQGYLEMLHYLLESHHVDINVGCGAYANGPTVLHNAILNGHGQVVRALLEHGGPVESFNAIAPIPPIREMKLFVAAFKKYRAPMKLLEGRDFELVREEIKDRGKVVVLHVGRKDMEWIGKLQLRHRDERLQDEGRELMTLDDAENHMQEELGDNARPTKKARWIPWLERMGLGG